VLTAEIRFGGGGRRRGVDYHKRKSRARHEKKRGQRVERTHGDVGISGAAPPAASMGDMLSVPRNDTRDFAAEREKKGELENGKEVLFDVSGVSLPKVCWLTGTKHDKREAGGLETREGKRQRLGDEKELPI